MVRLIGDYSSVISEYCVHSFYNSLPDISGAQNYGLYYKSSQSLISSSYYHWQDSSGSWHWADLTEYTRFAAYVDFDGHYKDYMTLVNEVFNNPPPWTDQKEFLYKKNTLLRDTINGYAIAKKYTWLFSISRSVPLEVIVPGSLYFDYLSDSIWMDLMNNYRYVNIIAG